MAMLQLLRTVRHLRSRQILGQTRAHIRPLWENPRRFSRRLVPDFPGCRWRPNVEFLPPGPQNNTAADIRRGHVLFLNRPHAVGWPPQWVQGELGKLWEYNLHYFEYLWTLECDQAEVIVGDWIANYDLRRQHVGWDPYPTSLRLVNWSAVFFGKFRKQAEVDVEFTRQLWRSIFLQAEWLARHMETHLLGNHLFENAVALCVVGCCFGGGAAERWYRKGKGVLADQIAEQILPDGVHFERSAMYHVRVAYLLALLLNTGDEGLAKIVREPLVRMVNALAHLCHPDGEIALLNDSAHAVNSTPCRLSAYVGRVSGGGPYGDVLPDGAFALPASGYYGHRQSDRSYVICDAGPIGPDYIPGHAHGDIFSFELSLNGHRVVVDSGVSDYEPGEMRRYCRSTRAHNTVEIAGEDQCEFWAVFRVARRGRPHDVTWQPTGDGFRLCGWHDGYRRLSGKPTHHRHFMWHSPGILMVKDAVVASRVEQRIVSRLHFHPTCTIDVVSADRIEVSYPAGRFAVCFAGPGRLAIEESWYCPEFGKRIRNQAAAFSATGRSVETGFCIAAPRAKISFDLAGGVDIDGRRYDW